ncbi:hypothetical protein [Pseudodesulfovibrio senegalensis]|jgi:hypothetical protein|uniref:Lipoprotein n=1 Tax=Pseudodesulfovibrio senegalensis TaxID=1721087 RepID=A0A6N6N201_9BACT|nr:hypothetical protein [Pseudodesulfovibrio senegalensis]KAB1441678.1 hypothetical protein F8A88_08760 [Pseudodesulfovibrio senegalensis]
MNNKRYFVSIVLGAAFLLLAACSPKTVVPLNYALVTANAGSCGNPINVLVFKDMRESRSIGRDSNGNLLQPGSDVADWVGWSLYEELNAAGCNVKYRSMRQTDNVPVVTGEVLDVRMTPTGNTTWKGVVKIHVAVEREGVADPGETFMSEVEKPVVFGVSSREDILSEALQGIMEQVVPKVMGQLQ